MNLTAHQPFLFEAMAQSRYPYTAAARKGSDTSKAAAPDDDRVSKLQARCLQILLAHECTADEIAAALKESVLTIRPRVAELKRQGKIRDTGKRRKNESGKTASVWGLA